VHWADEATLDLLRYLAAEPRALRMLLVTTYRDDETGPKHPLRVALGDLATAPGVKRMKLTGLSERAWARWPPTLELNVASCIR
jgi:predicted ATPase